MLEFFRKYQKFFFLFTTVVVVFSFSFFGTYNTFSNHEGKDAVAFTDLYGKKVMERELAQMTRFLATERQDCQQMPGLKGPNFLNDGVISRNFLQTGLAAELVKPFLASIGQELLPKLAREKLYKGYIHQSAPFINAEAVWNHFAPQVSDGLKQLRTLDIGEMSLATFELQQNLFLAQRKFSPLHLYQVLRYQEHQFGETEGVPAPHQLLLFGNTTIDDWFGQKFLKLACECIMNVAAVAKERGLVVTPEEAAADLQRMARAYALSQQIPVEQIDALMQEQLQMLGLDRARALAIWQDVLLFRRVFEGAGRCVLQDPLLYDQYTAFANAKAKIVLYQMPKEVLLKDEHDLQLFETYLSAISSREPHSLELPAMVKDIETLEKECGELVGRRYALEVVEISKDALRLKASLRQVWDWQKDEAHWEELASHFPAIAALGTLTADERVAALDQLGEKIKESVDKFTRDRLLKEHPNWIEEALASAPRQPWQVCLRLKGEIFPFKGIKDRAAFLALLETQSEKLRCYSEDGQHFYSVSVQECGRAKELLSFKEAKEDGTLQTLLDATLKRHWAQVCANDSMTYGKPGGGLKPFDEVRKVVADQYFSPLLLAIRRVAEQNGMIWNPKEDGLLGNFCAKRRFLVHLLHGKENLASLQCTSLWPIQETELDIVRKEPVGVDPQSVFACKEGQLSSCVKLLSGDIGFFKVLSFASAEENPNSASQMAQEAVGKEAQQYLMQTLVEKMLTAKALALPEKEELV